MPMDLRRAHEENDRAVLDAYNFPKNITESEIVSRLFEMYQNFINKKDPRQIIESIKSCESKIFLNRDFSTN